MSFISPNKILKNYRFGISLVYRNFTNLFMTKGNRYNLKLKELSILYDINENVKTFINKDNFKKEFQRSIPLRQFDNERFLPIINITSFLGNFLFNEVQKKKEIIMNRLIENLMPKEKVIKKLKKIKLYSGRNNDYIIEKEEHDSFNLKNELMNEGISIDDGVLQVIPTKTEKEIEDSFLNLEFFAKKINLIVKEENEKLLKMHRKNNMNNLNEIKTKLNNNKLLVHREENKEKESYINNNSRSNANSKEIKNKYRLSNNKLSIKKIELKMDTTNSQNNTIVTNNITHDYISNSSIYNTTLANNLNNSNKLFHTFYKNKTSSNQNNRNNQTVLIKNKIIDFNFNKTNSNFSTIYKSSPGQNPNQSPNNLNNINDYEPKFKTISNFIAQRNNNISHNKYKEKSKLNLLQNIAEKSIVQRCIKKQQENELKNKLKIDKFYNKGKINLMKNKMIQKKLEEYEGETKFKLNILPISTQYLRNNKNCIINLFQSPKNSSTFYCNTSLLNSRTGYNSSTKRNTCNNSIVNSSFLSGKKIVYSVNHGNINDKKMLNDNFDKDFLMENRTFMKKSLRMQTSRVQDKNSSNIITSNNRFNEDNKRNIRLLIHNSLTKKMK